MRINISFDPELRTDLDKIIGEGPLIEDKLISLAYEITKSVTKINSKV